jgi:hypothetical protein
MFSIAESQLTEVDEQRSGRVQLLDPIAEIASTNRGQRQIQDQAPQIDISVHRIVGDE